MHFFERLVVFLKNIQQRNIVNKRRFLEKCLFGMQMRDVFQRFRKRVSARIESFRTYRIANKTAPPTAITSLRFVPA